MYRAIAIAGLVVGLSVLSWAAPPQKQPPSKQPLSMVQKMNQRLHFPGNDDARATLSDVLDTIGKLYSVSFDINQQAFDLDQLKDVRRTPVCETPLPELKDVRLSRVLRIVLQRIPAPTGATYAVREDHIEITTNAVQRAEIWGSYRGPFLPLVNATFDKCPLEDAARELANQAEFTVLVDNHVADKTKTPVSARLLNTPLDTALRLLSDMTDLRTIHLDNVLYITSREKADALEQRLDKEKGGPQADQAPEPPLGTGWRKGSGRLFLLPDAGGM